MSAESAALLRIEYKLDLIISALQDQGAMLAKKHLPQLVDSAGDICPACDESIRYTLDLKSESTVRSCRCVPPIQAVAGISALLTPPTMENTNGRTSTRGPQEDSDPPDEAEAGAGKR